MNHGVITDELVSSREKAGDPSESTDLSNRTMAKQFATAGGIFVVSLISCEIGLSYLNHEYWTIVPIWPPVGVALAAFMLFGNRAWPPLLLGHSWMLVRLDSSAHMLLWSIPLLFTAEAWIASLIAKRIIRKSRTGNPLPYHILWQFVAPLIPAVPVAAITAFFVHRSWYPDKVILDIHFGDHSFLLILLLVFLAHMLAMAVFAPFLACMYRGEYRLLVDMKKPGRPMAVVLAATGLLLMVLGFSGRLASLITPQAVSMLPLPFLFVGAIWLNHTQARAMALVVCVIAISLTSRGLAPFYDMPGITAAHVELGFYLLIIAAGLNTMSWATSTYRRQLSHLSLIMDREGMRPWYWNDHSGIVFEHIGEKTNPGARRSETAVIPELFPPHAMSECANHWHRTHQEETPSGQRHWENIGHVTQRLPKGEAIAMVGLIKDVTSVETAHRTRLELERQKAIMHGLQA